MVYTAQPATAAELPSYGSVLRVVPADQLAEAAYEVAEEIAAKSPTIIRRAKESLNGIDPVDVSAATASSRASPTSCTSPAWPTSSGRPSWRSATPTPPGKAGGDHARRDDRRTASLTTDHG